MNMDMDGHEHGHRHEQKYEHRILKLKRNDILHKMRQNGNTVKQAHLSNFITRNRRGAKIPVPCSIISGIPVPCCIISGIPVPCGIISGIPQKFAHGIRHFRSPLP